MQIEYILFFIGIVILVVSLFLSYRLEKKQSTNRSGEQVLEEIKELKALYKKEGNGEGFKDELDDLYKLVEYKLNTTNEYVKVTRDRFSEFIEIKDSIVDFKKDISKSLDKLDKKIDNIEIASEEISTNVEENLQQLYNKNDNDLPEAVHNLIAEIIELKEDINELKNGIIITEEGDNRAEREDTGYNNLNNERIYITEEDNIEEEDNRDEKQENIDINEKTDSNEKIIEDKNSENESNNSNLEINENRNEKQELYHRIKEMKENGKDIIEIADSINMGIREVELFWKVNSRG